LPFDKPGRLAEAAQSLSDYIHRVQPRQRVDRRLAEGAPRRYIALQLCRFLAADDDAFAPLHRVEHRANDGRVLAQRIRTRCQRENAMHGRQPAVLARHVVSRRRNRTDWRPADHDLDVTERDQVREVRMTARKLSDVRHL